MTKKTQKIFVLLLSILSCFFTHLKAEDFSDNSFLIAELNHRNLNSQRFWNFITENNWTGMEFQLDTLDSNIVVKNTDHLFSDLLDQIHQIAEDQEEKMIPVFLKYSGDVLTLDSMINASRISNLLFFLPQGETWPSLEYLVQANRRIVFFVEGELTNESRILHQTKNYALEITADKLTPNSVILSRTSINMELFKVDNFEKLPVGPSQKLEARNLVPDYINYLLENWKKFGKRPNFIFVGNNYKLSFITDQLSSFRPIRGRVRTTDKNLEKVYWKNPDVLLTGGKFSFPYRGGEELILSPFAPGYQMTPRQIVVTGEMQIPENYSLMADPLKLYTGIKGMFKFENQISNELDATQTFEGSHYSFSQDIERGNVLRLPERANLNIGNPELYGLPNSSFTVSCFVKFTEILEFGDNAILGNYETGYRRGMHLILRSGHPYFGLWANDYMSTETLENNKWYHVTWRYIIETGEQAIFVNGQYVGGSDGHPPYSGSSDLHLGSALSQGASMRGYIDNLYFWNRPLSNEEIKRLSLDEKIENEELPSAIQELAKSPIAYAIGGLLLLILVFLFWIVFRLKRKKRSPKAVPEVKLPEKNQLQLFGKFKAIDRDGNDISAQFTPKVKELLVFTIIYSLKNSSGAPVTEVNEALWHGIDSKRVANNRAVTLNKLRKILVLFDEVEIVSNSGHLQLKNDSKFFCDYIEAFQLCQIPGGMNENQLTTFFALVKNGRLLKGTDWIWLDDMRGFIGNQVIDNLLKLASIYVAENKPKEVEKIAQRILDYDDLNEEATYLQIWALEKVKNQHLAQFNFNSFCSKYEKNMGEAYSMNFAEFSKFYADKLK